MDNNKQNLSMILINGLILGIIGALILITPLVADIPPDRIFLDIIAGGVLLVVGLVCLILELIKMKK